MVLGFLSQYDHGNFIICLKKCLAENSRIHVFNNICGISSYDFNGLHHVSFTKYHLKEQSTVNYFSTLIFTTSFYDALIHTSVCNGFFNPVPLTLDKELGFFLWCILFIGSSNEAILFWSSSWSQSLLLIWKILLAKVVWWSSACVFARRKRMEGFWRNNNFIRNNKCSGDGFRLLSYFICDVVSVCFAVSILLENKGCCWFVLILLWTLKLR